MVEARAWAKEQPTTPAPTMMMSYEVDHIVSFCWDMVANEEVCFLNGCGRCSRVSLWPLLEAGETVWDELVVVQFLEICRVRPFRPSLGGRFSWDDERKNHLTSGIGRLFALGFV